MGYTGMVSLATAAEPRFPSFVRGGVRSRLLDREEMCSLIFSDTFTFHWHCISNFHAIPIHDSLFFAYQVQAEYSLKRTRNRRSNQNKRRVGSAGYPRVIRYISFLTRNSARRRRHFYLCITFYSGTHSCRIVSFRKQSRLKQVSSATRPWRRNYLYVYRHFSFSSGKLQEN